MKEYCAQRQSLGVLSRLSLLPNRQLCEDAMRPPPSHPIIARAAFASILTVACIDPGHAIQPLQPTPASTLEMTVTTSGSDLDRDGYVIMLGRPTDSEGPSAYTRLPVNGSATLSGLAADTYTITLADLAANCDVITPLPKATVVTSAGVTRLSIHIQCTGSL